jgi:hypothetical protein
MLSMDSHFKLVSKILLTECTAKTRTPRLPEWLFTHSNDNEHLKQIWGSPPFNITKHISKHSWKKVSFTHMYNILGHNALSLLEPFPNCSFVSFTIFGITDNIVTNTIIHKFYARLIITLGQCLRSGLLGRTVHMVLRL